MRRLFIGVVLFVAALMPQGVSVASSDTNASGSGLELRIELASPSRPSGKVVMVNHGTDAITIWRTGNSWADEALSFEVMVDGHVHRVIRKPQVYTRNVAAAIALAPHDRYEMPFDLGDGGWESSLALAVDRRGAQIGATYRATPSTEATAQRLWIGEARSAPVTLP